MNHKKIRLILASQSKARRKLMEELKMPFECHTSGYEEDMSIHKNPAKLSKHLAVEKARYIAHKFPSSIIVGADTFITIGSHTNNSYQIIGKPSSYPEAEQIIKNMSGKTIKVHSGIAVIATDSQGKITKESIEHVLTKLKIKKMSPKEIHTLAHHDEALQISGAFSIEGEGGKMVERIDGDYNNVIGLPILQLQKILQEFDL
jgi:septum formation protein